MGKKEIEKADKDLVDNIGRRKWNLEDYKKTETAFDTAEEDDPYGYNLTSRPGDDANKNAVVVREPLQRRDFEVDLYSQVGKYTVVTANTGLSTRGGYYCDVCDCLLRDSSTYLDHINGKKHQKRLGMSMRVERASLSDVKKRLAHHKRKEGDAKNGIGVEERLAKYENEMRRRKKSKREMEKEEQEDQDDDEEEEEVEEVIDGNDGEEGQEDYGGKKVAITAEDEADQQEEELTEEEKMAKLMGFGTFSASKNKT